MLFQKAEITTFKKYRIHPSKSLFNMMISGAIVAKKGIMTKRKFLTQEMFQHITRWRESGMTMVNYAKQIGIINPKLKYWIQKLEKQETGKDQHYRKLAA